MRGGGFAPPTPGASALRCCFRRHRFIAFTRGVLFPLAYMVLSCCSYYFDTSFRKTHPYPSSLFSAEPLVPAFPALFQCPTDAAEQFAVCMPVIVLHTLNPFSSYPGTECFVILTSCGANAAPVVIVHRCHIAIVFIMSLYNLFTCNRKLFANPGEVCNGNNLSRIQTPLLQTCLPRLRQPIQEAR